MLILNQPYSRVLSSKKVPLTDILKFLMTKGITPLPDTTKSELSMAFKSLVESQPDYIRPTAQYIQPMQMPNANNMLALGQNHNMMMHCQPFQPSVPQV